LDSTRPDIIEEVSEPQSPEDTGDAAEDQPSALTNLMRDNSPPKGNKDFLGYGTNSRYADSDQYTTPSVIVDDVDDGITEITTLLPRERIPGRPAGVSQKISGYGEEMEIQFKNRWAKLKYASQDVIKTLSHPKEWDLREISSVTVGAVAAVFLGLLLNILDALSYGKCAADLVTASFRH
jgi:hypothetical protein